MAAIEKAAWFMAGWLFSNTLFLMAAMLYIMRDCRKEIKRLTASPRQEAHDAE